MSMLPSQCIVYVNPMDEIYYILEYFKYYFPRSYSVESHVGNECINVIKYWLTLSSINGNGIGIYQSKAVIDEKFVMHAYLDRSCV